MIETPQIQVPSKKLETLEVLRALAALSVVAFHSREQPYLKGLGESLLPIFAYGKYGVPVFFALSGFIILFIHGKDLGKSGRCSNYFYRRWLRIWPIYAALTLAQVAGKPFISGQGVESFSQVMTSLFFLDLENTPIINVGWTLVHEAFFYLTFGILIMFSVRFSAWFGVVFLLGMIGYHFDPAEANPLVEFIFSHMKWFFLAGIAAACLTPVSLTGLPETSRRLGALFFSVMILVGGVTLVAFDSGKTTGTTLFLAAGIGIFLLGIVSLDLRFQPRMPRILVYLGAASYSIYLVHSTVLDMGLVVLRKVSPGLLAGQLDIVMLCLALTSVICGVICHEILEKPLIRWIRSFSKPIVR